MWDLSNHDLFGIIHDPGGRKKITLSLESISTIPFQGGTSYVKIVEWGQHGSKRRMPCLVSIFGNFQGTGDQPNKNPGALLGCTADIISNITNCEITRPGMLIARKIGQVSLVGCTYDWHNCRSGRKLSLHIPPPIAGVHLTEYLAIVRVCKVHRLKIEVHMRWEMCQQELDTFENIPVV